MKTLDVKIGSAGQVVIETFGFTGESCKTASKFLEALGVVEDDAPTPEMYEEVTEKADVSTGA